MIRQHVVRGMSAPVAVGLLLLLGCSGTGDVIPMNLTPKAPKDASGAVQSVKPMAGPRVTANRSSVGLGANSGKPTSWAKTAEM